VAGEIGAAAIAVSTDVSNRSDIDEMVHAAKSAFGRVDILVNNAGYTHVNGDMLDIDEATFELVYAVNMKAIYHPALAVVPIMERQRRGTTKPAAAPVTMATLSFRRMGSASGGSPSAERYAASDGSSGPWKPTIGHSKFESSLK